MQRSKLGFEKYKVISGSVLKLVAIITMFVDHFAVILYDSSEIFEISLLQIFGRNITVYYLLRKMGRLAFPIFCFLVAEGFNYTKNPKKYIFSLAIFALISEIPFNLMVSGEIFFIGKQNVYFTLLFGALLLYVLNSKLNYVHKFLLAVLMIVAIPVLKVDYGINGVILIFVLYLFRNNKLCQVVSSYPLLSGGYAAWSAILLTVFYNGKRGFIKSKALKYVFYIFYPLHIAILLLVKYFIS